MRPATPLLTRLISIGIAGGLCALSAGCMDGLPTEDPQAVEHRGACLALENLTFHSVAQADCGLTPDGPALCNWSLTFTPADATRTAFAWSHSDVGEAGYVTCDGSSVRSDEATLYAGTFSDTLDLIWDDRPYAVVP